MRLGRFAATGAVAAAAQLALLAAFLEAGAPPTLSNALAIALAAQVNFGLSRSFTWHDRPREGRLVFDWARFMVAVSASAALNLTVVEATRRVIEPLPAAALGILAGAALNFVVADRLIFSARGAAESRRAAHEAHP
jgi:putative flippase GtrA